MRAPPTGDGLSIPAPLGLGFSREALQLRESLASSHPPRCLRFPSRVKHLFIGSLVGWEFPSLQSKLGEGGDAAPLVSSPAVLAWGHPPTPQTFFCLLRFGVSWVELRGFLQGAGRSPGQRGPASGSTAGPDPRVAAGTAQCPAGGQIQRVCGGGALSLCCSF